MEENIALEDYPNNEKYKILNIIGQGAFGTVYLIEKGDKNAILVEKISGDYNNVVGLKRRFAIEVDEYDEKARKSILIVKIFNKI